MGNGDPKLITLNQQPYVNVLTANQQYGPSSNRGAILKAGI